MNHTTSTRHRWLSPSLRGGGRDKCQRCGLRKTNLRNPETGHFEELYHLPDGPSKKAGKCG